MSIDNDVRTTECDPRNASALGSLLARYVPNVAKRSIWDHCKKYINYYIEDRPTTDLTFGKISNGHISARGHPIPFMFGSRVGFLMSADRMALFPVAPNSGHSRYLGETRAVLSPGNRAKPCKFRYVKVGQWRTSCESCAIAKDDRAMRPIRGCPENFRDSWLRPRLLFPTFFMGFYSDPPYECSFKIWSP